MDLTRQLRGREISAVLTNGSVLQIRTKDGREINIKWVDANGETLKGIPLIQTVGLRLRCEGMREIISGRSVGVAL